LENITTDIPESLLKGAGSFALTPLTLKGKQLPITISCGAAESDGHLDIDQLLKHADENLYHQKRQIEISS